MRPFFFNILKFVDIFWKLFILYGVILDFRDHNFVQKVNFPELLVVADLFVILGINLE
jgi:hypothetical protein